MVRVFNDRGACLAGAVLDDGVMPQVAVMATGAWFDPAREAERSRAPRQSQRAHARCRHVPPDARPERLERAGADRALERRGFARAAHFTKPLLAAG